MRPSAETEKVKYAPFVLTDRFLLLSDQPMEEKRHIFEGRVGEGWTGNGYDWTSIAQVIVAERIPEVAGNLSFDPEAGMFSAAGSRDILEQLASAMHAVFHDDDTIRDLLSRAEMD